MITKLSAALAGLLVATAAHGDDGGVSTSPAGSPRIGRPRNERAFAAVPTVFFFILTWTTAIMFNPERFRGTLKSRWEQQNEQLREITRTFRSQK